MTEAPRWRLITAHYLNVPGTEWEYKEADRTTGKQVRKIYTVPALLDPRDPSDCNYPGELIVTHEVEGARLERRDIIFLGDPTPDMEPLNEAAEVISTALAPKWQHPIDALPANGGGDFAAQLLAGLEKQLASAINNAGGIPQAQSAGMVSQEAFDALKAELESMKAAMAAKAEPAGRRV